MRILSIVLSAALVVSLGCGTTNSAGSGGSKNKRQTTTVDGLVRVDIEGRGDLFLRKDHGIGGYDAIAIAPSFINYRRTSARLDEIDEEVYLVSLEQSLVDIAEAAEVPIENALGNCVIKVGAGFVNVDLARSDSAKVLGRMTLVIEYKDSMSGQSLLRYAAQEEIEKIDGGSTREEQIGDSFDRMIEEVNLIAALTAATSVPSPPRPGCEGALVKARTE
jgi:hypothetical protein